MNDRAPDTHQCNCSIRELDEETRFTIRYGAHEKICAIYRPSLDPVDRIHDEAERAIMDAAAIEAAKDTERARLQRKAERFGGFADSAARSSNAAWKRAHDLVTDIPLGQPILVDHYSASRHRRALWRSHTASDKGVTEGKRAAKWEARTEGVEREMKRKGLL